MSDDELKELNQIVFEEVWDDPDTVFNQPGGLLWELVDVPKLLKDRNDEGPEFLEDGDEGTGQIFSD